MNEENLNRYAKVLVEYGVGLQEGQRLYVLGQVAHRVLAGRIAQAAYERGSSLVDCRLVDPLLTEPLIRHGPMECVDLDHDRDRLWFNDIVRTRGAFIALVGSERPHLMPELARTHPERQAAVPKEPPPKSGQRRVNPAPWRRFGHRG
jgi:leucyl aminopeptidase (aminopeptidase T)